MYRKLFERTPSCSITMIISRLMVDCWEAMYRIIKKLRYKITKVAASRMARLMNFSQVEMEIFFHTTLLGCTPGKIFSA